MLLRLKQRPNLKLQFSINFQRLPVIWEQGRGNRKYVAISRGLFVCGESEQGAPGPLSSLLSINTAIITALGKTEPNCIKGVVFRCPTRP